MKQKKMKDRQVSDAQDAAGRGHAVSGINERRPPSEQRSGTPVEPMNTTVLGSQAFEPESVDSVLSTEMHRVVSDVGPNVSAAQSPKQVGRSPSSTSSMMDLGKLVADANVILRSIGLDLPDTVVTPAVTWLVAFGRSMVLEPAADPAKAANRVVKKEWGADVNCSLLQGIAGVISAYHAALGRGRPEKEAIAAARRAAHRPIAIPR